MPTKKPKSDEELIQYLQTLKDRGEDYPSDMLEKQRSSYQESIKSLVGLIPVGGFQKFWKTLIPHTTEGILQTILVSTVFLVAGTIGYLYREQIKDWVTPEIATPTAVTSAFQPRITPESTFTGTPEASATFTPVLPTPIVYATDQGHHYGQTHTPRP
jgi:hypothetical protein